ncbi:hypothetical protein K435DRAFT_875835 [Dendrothele bispora CBS 962.96]|uniref:Uncharacterized protein n=1 Tax=Dendrothele bispora (strain CBS 962.96) TaxID=1314807 RepID=A0A4S8KTS8_DENBC|nr:hypothetical protein K435DRAFT_875835 [Dendrothele bispora CBS 962.96]
MKSQSRNLIHLILILILSKFSLSILTPEYSKTARLAIPTKRLRIRTSSTHNPQHSNLPKSKNSDLYALTQRYHQLSFADVEERVTGIVKRKSNTCSKQGPVKAWNTEDIIRNSDSHGRRPEDDEQQQLPGGELYLVDSPVQEYCGGDCREKLDEMFEKLTHDNRRGGGEGGGGGENHAMEDSFEGSGQVVSLSSCRDNQLAWESTDGKSMTKFLVKQLRKQSHPFFTQLMTTLSHDLYKAAVGMHQEKEYKRGMKLWRKEKNKAKSRSTSDTNGLEMTNFQNPIPKLSSTGRNHQGSCSATAINAVGRAPVPAPEIFGLMSDLMVTWHMTRPLHAPSVTMCDICDS